MTLEQLQAQRQSLLIQRSQAKDIVEQSERALGEINLAITVLEADAKAREEVLAEAGAETND